MTELLDTRTSSTTTPDAAEIARLHARIRKLRRPCGCKSGAAFTLLALIGWPIAVIVNGPPHSLAGIVAAVALYPVAVLVAALVGKVSGIVVGRTRRRWYQHRLHALVG